MNEIQEKIYIDTFANLLRGIEFVGGRIKISDRSIVFTSHEMNIQKGETEILIEQITSIRKRNTLGIVPNGLRIETRDGQQYKFVLWNRQKIIEIITKLYTKRVTIL